MSFTDTFIRHPVWALVVNLFILVLGVRALATITVRQYPQTTNAVVTVNTNYPGAAADVVEGFITTPLEEQIMSANGIDYLESQSMQGASAITAHIVLDFDPNAALTQIMAKVQRQRYMLPQEAEDPQINIDVGESTDLMYIAFFSDSLEQNQITDYLMRVVQPKLATVSGVQLAEILGEKRFAMRIWLDSDKMAALGVSPGDVWNALDANHYVSSAGKSKGNMISVNLTASTDLHRDFEFKKLIVKREKGATIYLRDVGTVSLGAQDYDRFGKFNGANAVFIGIKVAPAANPLTVLKDIRKMIPELETQFPPGLKANVTYDASEYIDAAISDVASALEEAVVIVIVVIFLFLGSVRSVFIPIVTIPLSLLGAVFMMLAMGFSLNLLTLLAMVLAIGLVVDDAIIVVENIHRHIEEGKPPLEAALLGARELGGPIIAMTITLAAVYAPIGFMGGLTGALFTEFAFSLAGAVLVSGVVALTLSPMMCAYILKPPQEGHGGLAHFLDMFFEKVEHAYEKILHGALQGVPFILAFGVTVLVSCAFLFSWTKKELAPVEDQAIILVQSTGAANASIDQTEMWGRKLVEIYHKFPEVANSFFFGGFASGAQAPTNTAISAAILKPWDQRQRTQMQIMPLIQKEIDQVPGMLSVSFSRPSLPGTVRGVPLQFVVQSTEAQSLIYERAEEIKKRTMQSGLFMFVDNSLKFDRPHGIIEIDREKASDLGINMRQVGLDLMAALSGNYVNWFSVEGRDYQVIPQVKRVERLNVDQLKDYYTKTKDGQMIPLSTVVRVKTVVEPQQLPHFQQLRSATIQAMTMPGVSMGQALDFLKQAASEILPPGYSVDYAGEARQYVQESAALVTTFLFAIIIIYLVLAFQFESFRDPIIMLVTVPMSIAGALAFLFAGLATLNIYTQVGLVTLIGLISKHGILIVQFANQLQKEGLSKREAIEKAAGIRLRPILMTTAAMVAGVIPLVFATGAGAQSRYCIGLVITTGLSIGTLFTLFVVPAVYMALAADHHEKAAA